MQPHLRRYVHRLVTWKHVEMKRMTQIYRLGSITLLCVLSLTFGCRAIETPEELPTLAGDIPQELPVVSSPPSSAVATPGDDSLDSFPLLGSVFPGLGGRLHSSLCDPASDPYSTCI